MAAMRMARMSMASIASTMGRSLGWVKARFAQLEAEEARAAEAAAEPAPEATEEEGGDGVVLRGFHLWEGGFGAAIQRPCGQSVFVPTGERRLKPGAQRDVEIINGKWALAPRRRA